MGVCANCGGALGRAWKYCIYCGTTLSPAAVIPGAIRPDAEPERRRSRLDVPLLVGIALAAAGAGMIIYLAVLFLLPRG